MQITVISDAPIIVSGDNFNTINSSDSSNIVSVLNTINNIYSVDQSNNVVVINSASSINASSPSQIIIAASTQGPQGIQGPIGPIGNSTVAYTAPINLGGNRVVTSSITYADNTNLLTAGKAIGITTSAATINTTVNIQIIGELNGFSGLVSDSPVYLSTLGTVTQTLPLSGYVQKIGMATSSTTLLINISEPIVL